MFKCVEGNFWKCNCFFVIARSFAFVSFGLKYTSFIRDLLRFIVKCCMVLCCCGSVIVGVLGLFDDDVWCRGECELGVLVVFFVFGWLFCFGGLIVVLVMLMCRGVLRLWLCVWWILFGLDWVEGLVLDIVDEVWGEVEAIASR